MPKFKYGGMTLAAGDENRLLIGGAANESTAAIYAVTLIRSACKHIVGFAGPAQKVAEAPYIDGGLVYGPGNVLMFAAWPREDDVRQSTSGMASTPTAAKTSNFRSARLPSSPSRPTRSLSRRRSTPGRRSSSATTSRVGRRRCAGSNLEICEETGWVLLQPCMQDETCDVAVCGCLRPSRRNLSAGRAERTERGGAAEDRPNLPVQGSSSLLRSPRDTPGTGQRSHSDLWARYPYQALTPWAR